MAAAGIPAAPWAVRSDNLRGGRVPRQALTIAPQAGIGGASGPLLDDPVGRDLSSANSGITYFANRSRLAKTFLCRICWSKLIMQQTRSTPTSSQYRRFSMI